MTIMLTKEVFVMDMIMIMSIKISMQIKLFSVPLFQNMGVLGEEKTKREKSTLCTVYD